MRWEVSHRIVYHKISVHLSISGRTAFRIIQRRWGLPFEQIVYVGDNAEKDFQAPKQLGMQRVWVQNNEGLYQNRTTDIGFIQEIGKKDHICRMRDDA